MVQLLFFIPKENIDTNIWSITNNITHIKKDKILKTDDYVR